MYLLYIEVLIKCRVLLEDVESKKRDKILKRGMGIDFVSKLVFFFFLNFRKVVINKINAN